MNRVLQLNNSQSGKLVQQSCGEIQNETFSQQTHPKPKPICDLEN